MSKQNEPAKYTCISQGATLKETFGAKYINTAFIWELGLGLGLGLTLILKYTCISQGATLKETFRAKYINTAFIWESPPPGYLFTRSFEMINIIYRFSQT